MNHDSFQEKLALIKAVTQVVALPGVLRAEMMDKGINKATMLKEIPYIEQSARACFAQDGNCNPILITFSDENGVLISAVTPLFSLGEIGKNALADLIRMDLVSHPDILGIVMVTEGWSGKPDKNGKIVGKKQEIVIIHAETRDGGILQKIIPIERDGKCNGRMGDSEVNDLSEETPVGRFCGFFKKSPVHA